MLEVRRSSDRGIVNLGWLNSRHTFSFGHYYDPKQMGFSSLRVINDDHVIPGAGFETHGHKDMEIISLVLDGVIAHKDSEGNVKELPAGEYQLMSAGSGIYHSEFNVSEEDPLRFLQIWIKPNINGGEPRYQQKAFPQTKGLVDIVTPDGQNDTLQVKQDAYLRQLIVPVNEDYRLEINESRAYYLHLITGDIQINDIDLSAGDGIKISKQTLIEIHSNGEVAAKALVFDLP